GDLRLGHAGVHLAAALRLEPVPLGPLGDPGLAGAPGSGGRHTNRIRTTRQPGAGQEKTPAGRLGVLLVEVGGVEPPSEGTPSPALHAEPAVGSRPVAARLAKRAPGPACFVLTIS